MTNPKTDYDVTKAAAQAAPNGPKYQDEAREYDAILVVSFGGPEGQDDVIPFLENVLRGRNVPRERLEEVSHHYRMFGGVSPINEQNRLLIEKLQDALKEHGPDLPIYFGNRNWHPMLTDTMRQMRDDGIERALCLFTSAYSCYSGCRQYRENLYAAQQAVGEGAPEVDKVRMFYNHPDFIAANADHLQQALDRFPAEKRANVKVAFTAHSIPDGMANRSDYEVQLKETSRLVAEAVGLSSENWELVYQSRSGPPHQPWLEPDILDYMEAINDNRITDIVIMPVGFISDHMEVMYDLDTEAEQLAQERGMTMVRAATVGVHPKFVGMLRELIVERMTENPERRAIGERPANHDVCPTYCCLPR